MAIAAMAEEMSNDRPATVSSEAHMIGPPNEVVSNAAPKGAAWSRGLDCIVEKCPHNFEGRQSGLLRRYVSYDTSAERD